MERLNRMLTLLGICTVLLCFGLIFWRAFRSRLAPVRSVRARVADKHRSEVFSKSARRYRCVVVFEAEGKRLAFQVSELSYGGYTVGRRGTLKYRGDRLLDFQ